MLEANPRASRTVPFVAKATGIALVEAAVRVALGERVADLEIVEIEPPMVSVKEAVLPFSRFPGADALLGPEMRSTGEVMGMGPDFATAFAKAARGAGHRLPTGSGGRGRRRAHRSTIATSRRRRCWRRDSRRSASGSTRRAGTARALRTLGIEVADVSKISGEGGPQTIPELIRAGLSTS